MIKKVIITIVLSCLALTSFAGTKVLMETNKGNVTIELNDEKAPISSQNFLDYVNSGFYDGLIFHRVISSFMVQGGGFDADMKQKKTNAPILNEADNGLKNKRGSIAMARTANIDSATSQFFINTKDNTFLNHRSKNQNDYGYAVFGEVIDGMEVIDAIEAVKTGRKNGFSDVPVEPIVIQKMSVIAP